MAKTTRRQFGTFTEIQGDFEAPGLGYENVRSREFAGWTSLAFCCAKDRLRWRNKTFAPGTLFSTDVALMLGAAR